MNKRSQAKFAIIFIAIALGIFLIPKILSETSYVIKGDTVEINNSNIYLSATPHTTSGQPVVFSLISKVYEGNANLVFGFDEYSKPRNVEYYNPHYVNETHSFTCNFSNRVTFFNYTLTPKKHGYCYINYEDGTELYFNHSFEWGNLATATIYWNESVLVEWSPLEKEWNLKNYDYDGKTKWYYLTNIPIIKGKEYKLRGNIDIVGGEGYTSKYDVAIYPSAYGSNLQQAVADGKLYYLDPWIAYGDNALLLVWQELSTKTAFYKNGTWANSWSSIGTIPSNSSAIYDFFIDIIKDPYRSKSAVISASAPGTGTSTGKLNISLWDGNKFTHDREIIGLTDLIEYHPFAAAFEQSGDLLVIVDNESSAGVVRPVSYERLANGTWQLPNVVSSVLSTTESHVLRAYPKPNSDVVMLMIMDRLYDLYAFYWNGTNWTSNNFTLETSVSAAVASPSWDGAWYPDGSKFIAVWDGETTTVDLESRVWNGTGWEAEITQVNTTILNDVEFIQLTSHPTENYIIGCLKDESDDVYIFDFNSSLGIVNTTKVDADTDTLLWYQCDADFFKRGESYVPFFVWNSGTAGYYLNDSFRGVVQKFTGAEGASTVRAEVDRLGDSIVWATSDTTEDLQTYIYNTSTGTIASTIDHSTNLQSNSPSYDVAINQYFQAETDTCTYSGSGDWNANCYDNCTITENQVGEAGYNVTWTGDGIWILEANITGFAKYSLFGSTSANKCIIRGINGGGIRK